MTKVRLSYRSLASVVALFLFPACLTLAACAQQPSEMKIVDLEGELVMRIDAAGSVFNDLDKEIAAINDREGSLTITRDHQKIALKNDPTIQRENDLYRVKLGDGFTFEVKSDGAVLLDGKPYWRVSGYAQQEVQRNRFIAALALIPLLKSSDIFVALPRAVTNSENDRAMRKQVRISIPNDDEIYLGNELIPKGDSYSQLGQKLDDSLKRQPAPNRIVNIAGSVSVEWGTIVQIINSAREKGVDRIGLIVEGNNGSENRFLLPIPHLRDPNEDILKSKPNPNLLRVTLSTHQELKLNTGGYEVGVFTGTEQAVGIASDASVLSNALTGIFRKRKEQHLYKTGMETRTDLSEDERVEKTVVIKAYRSCLYGEVIKIIDVVKGAGANPIILQLDDVPW
jgi:biopolymer transport protein ExbD